MRSKTIKIGNCPSSKNIEPSQARTLKSLFEDFKRRYRDCVVPDDGYFKGLSLKAAITKAALAENETGGRYSHQRRISKTAIEGAKENLLANEAAIEAATDFDDLLARVQAILAGVDGVGELYCYDTANRIGIKLGKIPHKVYLHRGTREGAAAIDPAFRKRDSLEIGELPDDLRNESASDLEDFLCIYKRELKTLFSNNSLKG
jgi:hypothetical protein